MLAERLALGPDGLAAFTAARIRVPLLVAGGILGALAFPSTNWWPLTWIALLPSLLGALVLPPRLALRDGWLQGTVFFLLLLRWLDHTFRNYSAIPWPLTWLPIVALAAYCGLYFGAATLWVAWARIALGNGWALALVPPLWVSGEWLRGWLMGRLPLGTDGILAAHRAARDPGRRADRRLRRDLHHRGGELRAGRISCAGLDACLAGDRGRGRAGAGHPCLWLERPRRRGAGRSAARGRDTAEYRAARSSGTRRGMRRSWTCTKRSPERRRSPSAWAIRLPAPR